ncbi:hypothetical protein PsYK624_072650 [Phanerochaete sordida]|uniref:Uncharacterized protein n=1 Tax=Phanerochaete sordida TaxID=48140 RepID=A0A9P3GA54_9APHY|nr:hypothetical protein PsYK624_072650 [Phanerochaete sordida]
MYLAPSRSLSPSLFLSLYRSSFLALAARNIAPAIVRYLAPFALTMPYDCIARRQEDLLWILVHFPRPDKVRLPTNEKINTVLDTGLFNTQPRPFDEFEDPAVWNLSTP